MIKHPRVSLFLTTSWNPFLKSSKLKTLWIYDLPGGPWVSQTIHPVLWGSEGLERATQLGQPRFMSWLNCKLMMTFSRYLLGVHLGRCSFYRRKWNFLKHVWSVPCVSLQSSKTLLSHQLFQRHLKHGRVTLSSVGQRRESWDVLFAPGSQSDARRQWKSVSFLSTPVNRGGSC